MKVRLSLQEKNYGLPLGKTVYSIANFFYNRYRTKPIPNDNHYEYPRTYEIVDSDRLRIRKGDIIQFNHCMFKKEIYQEFGVILERYRIIKQKNNGTFKDYYAIALITTGKLKGELYHVTYSRVSALKKEI